MGKSIGIQKLIKSIELSSKRGQDTLVYKTSSQQNEVLNLLYQQGLIKSYQEFPGIVVIKLKTSVTEYRPFINIEKPKRINHKKTVSFSDLTRLQRKDGGSSYYVLSTDKGIITSFDAITNNIGGKILFKVS